MPLSNAEKQTAYRDRLRRNVTGNAVTLRNIMDKLLKIEEDLAWLRNRGNVTKNASTLREDSKKESKRGARLADDWMPAYDYASDYGLDPGRTLQAFRNHFLAKPGKDGVKLDWERTYHNWCMNDRKAVPNGHDTPVPVAQTPREPPPEIDYEEIRRRESQSTLFS